MIVVGIEPHNAIVMRYRYTVRPRIDIVDSIKMSNLIESRFFYLWVYIKDVYASIAGEVHYQSARQVHSKQRELTLRS